MISSYPIETGNYPIVLNILKATYGDQEQIKLAHTLDFIRMPEISHTSQDLADFRASMDQHTIALKNHKISLEEFQTLVCYFKLPPTLPSVFRCDLGVDCRNY